MARTRSTPAIVAAGSLAAATLLGGCISVSTTRVYTSASPVTQAQMADLVARTRTLHVGMSRDEALATFPADYTNLKSGMTDNGRTFEEWQVEAYDKRREVYFRRYLYMVDSRLAAFSDTRIDYRENAETRNGWANRGQFGG